MTNVSGVTKTGKKVTRAPSLERGLAVLETLGKSKRGLTLSEISRRLELPKSTTHCLLVTLRDLEYATCLEKTRRYVPGRRFLKLSNIALQGMWLREQTSTLLRGLHERTRLTVHMAILDEHDVVLIEKVETASSARLATWVGRRMEVHCTGLGKAILAYLPESELEIEIRNHGLPKHNENTIASPRKLREALEGIRQAGYALDDEEDELGFRCVAAPIFDHDQHVMGSISIAGTLEQVKLEDERFLAERTMETAAAISSVMRTETYTSYPAKAGHSARPGEFPPARTGTQASSSS